jgi:hypothetical protein
MEQYLFMLLIGAQWSSFPAILVVVAIVGIALTIYPIKIYDGRVDGPAGRRAAEYVRENAKYSFMTAVTSHKSYPTGLVFGPGFLAWTKLVVVNMYDDKKEHIVMMFCWKDIDILPKKEELAPLTHKKQRVDVLAMTGGSMDSHFEKTQEGAIIRPGTPRQNAIVDTIVTKAGRAKKNGHEYNFTALIHGKSGTGKSYVAYLLAKKLGCPIMTEWDPFEFGHCVSTIRKETAYSSSQPIVVLFDEFDVGTKRCLMAHKNEQPRHRWMRTPVWNKISLCSVLDALSKEDGLFVVVTMNKAPKKIDKRDTAILRKGRICERFVLTDNVAKKFIAEKYA